MAASGSLVPSYDVSDQALLLVCVQRAARLGLVPADARGFLKELILARRPALVAAARAFRNNRDEADLLDTLLLVADLPPPPSLITPAPALPPPSLSWAHAPTRTPPVSVGQPVGDPKVGAGTLRSISAVPQYAASSSEELRARTVAASVPVATPAQVPTVGCDAKGPFALMHDAPDQKLRSVTALPSHDASSFEELRAHAPAHAPSPAPAPAAARAVSSSGAPPSVATTVPPPDARSQALLRLVQAAIGGAPDASLAPELRVPVSVHNGVPTAGPLHVGVLGPALAGKSALISLLVDGTARPPPAPPAARALSLHTNVGVLSFVLHEGRAVPSRPLHAAILLGAPDDESALRALRAQLPPRCAVYVAVGKADTRAGQAAGARLRRLAAALAPVVGVADVSARTALNAERPLLALARTLCGFPLLTFEPQPAPPPERDAPAAPRYVW